MTTGRLDFGGRSTIVTGAGRGLGRAHALLLAARGARVVVNDLGVGVDGVAPDSSPAIEVVAAIEAFGGEAVADHSDISTPEGAAALVDTAMTEFGGVDAVVNNAGVDFDDPFPAVSWVDFSRAWAVNAGGTFLVTQAAWPHLISSGTGRVVLTASGTGVYGALDRTHYASSKGAVFGLMRALALEGEPVGVLVNGLAPVAFTRLAETFAPEEMCRQMAVNAPADDVAPVVAWLTHSACRVTGRLSAAGSRRVAEIYVAETPGIRPPQLDPETIGERLEEIVDRAGSFEARESGESVRIGLARHPED